MLIKSQDYAAQSRKWIIVVIILVLIVVCLSYFSTVIVKDHTINEDEEDRINPGHTAWMIASTCFVLLMTMPGLTMYYGGFANKTSQLNTMTMIVISYSIVSVIWIAYGYNLVFGDDKGGIIGNSSHFFLNNLSPYSVYKEYSKIPEYIVVMFQLTFAALTVALVSGGLIERVKFISWVFFVILWTTLVYIPICHWVWGGGFLESWGVRDYAGGTVVHINSGIATLVGTVILGKRLTPHENPRSMAYILTGTSMLWFGFLGFNAGAAYRANIQAATALLNANISAISASISWTLIQTFHTGKPTLAGLCDGAISGLVGMTPTAGFSNVNAAFSIGIISGIVVYGAIYMKVKLNLYDDTFNAFGIHFFAGFIGAILTGVYSEKKICRDHDRNVMRHCEDGLLFGNSGLIGKQIAGALICMVYSGIMTILIMLFLKKTIGLRVSEEDELDGLDKSQHGDFHYMEYEEEKEVYVIKHVKSINKTKD